MTPQELANELNAAQRGEEISPAEERLAKENHLVVVFGYSDDAIEFRGAIRDEKGAYEDTIIFIHPTGFVLRDYHDCNCDHCNYAKVKNESTALKALWAAEPGYSWTFKTDIPHATFDIFDGAEPFCRGIVFSLPLLK